MRITLLAILVGCGGGGVRAPAPSGKPGDDPVGPHRDAVTAQVEPLLRDELVSGLVVGLYDAGKLEIYGFGKGPRGRPPNGSTLFELGSVTQVYTSLLLADAIQRREVELDTTVSELLPPGVTVPTKDSVAITLRHLVLHSSGLSRLPPSIDPHAKNPYAAYGEENLYQDLVQTALAVAPGQRILYSNWGVGLLGFTLGKKLGTGYTHAVETRILAPLGLTDTFFTVPPAAQTRRALGTTSDLAAAPMWTFDALAGAGALVSTAHDQLELIDAELDAASGSKQPLRPAMRLSQEAQLEGHEDNEGLGWQIDRAGRFWHNGATGGFHAFVGFDPKLRRGVVILASSATSLVDHLADRLYQVLAGETPKQQSFPDATQLGALAGSYRFQGMTLVVSLAGKRLYVEGPGEPRIRLLPISDHEFWIEDLQSVVVFEREGDRVARAIFLLGAQRMVAERITDPAAP